MMEVLYRSADQSVVKGMDITWKLAGNTQTQASSWMYCMRICILIVSLSGMHILKV